MTSQHRVADEERQEGGKLTHLFPVVKNDDFAVLVVHRHRALVPLACRHRNTSAVKTRLQERAVKPNMKGEFVTPNSSVS